MQWISSLIEELQKEVDAQGGLVDKIESVWRFAGGVPKVLDGEIVHVPLGSTLGTGAEESCAEAERQQRFMSMICES